MTTSSAEQLRMQCLSLAASLYGKRHVPGGDRAGFAGTYVPGYEVAQPIEEVIKAADRMWAFVLNTPVAKAAAKKKGAR